MLTLLSQAPPSAITANGWSGRTVPVVCTSSGRAPLFDHDLAALRTLLDGTDFHRYSSRAPADLTDLQRRIAAGRERGYAAVDEEFEPGLVGIAAPGRDIAGRIIAAVNVSGPKFRLGSRFSVTGEAVRRAADALSESVFGEPDAPAAPASVTV